MYFLSKYFLDYIWGRQYFVREDARSSISGWMEFNGTVVEPKMWIWKWVVTFKILFPNSWAMNYLPYARRYDLPTYGNRQSITVLQKVAWDFWSILRAPRVPINVDDTRTNEWFENTRKRNLVLRIFRKFEVVHKRLDKVPYLFGEVCREPEVTALELHPQQLPAVGHVR